MTYPLWAYFPRNVPPPEWAYQLASVVAGAEDTISTAAKKTGLRGEGSSAWNGPRFLHRRVDQRDR